MVPLICFARTTTSEYVNVLRQIQIIDLSQDSLRHFPYTLQSVSFSRVGSPTNMITDHTCFLSHYNVVLKKPYLNSISMWATFLDRAGDS